MKNLTSIGKNAFKGSRIIEIRVPANVQTIEEGAFYECKNLKKVTFTEGS